MFEKYLDCESLLAENQDLTFDYFEKWAKREIGLENFSQDILRILNLYDDDLGYNQVAELLSDQNSFPGIELIHFGDSINVITKRATFDHESVLKELDDTVNVFLDYYSYEEISGMTRKKVFRIPEEAFRETVANALMHRTWDIPAQIRVMMFDDRIEVTSPGVLPAGLSEEEYSRGNISILRNPILGNIFYRLHIVETLGTGILRIQEAYKDSERKPIFEAFANSVKVTLPVQGQVEMTSVEGLAYDTLSKNILKPIVEITDALPYSRSKVSRILKDLIAKNLVVKVGNGRGTRCKKRT